MARIRSVKPDFYRDEDLQDLERANPGKHTMLVFSGLWGHCDKNGNFEWNPRMLKLDILPFLDFDMAETLDALMADGFVTTYKVDGDTYGHIPTFKDHQRINGKEASEPGKYPRSDGEATEKQLGGQEGKGKEGKGRESSRARPDSVSQQVRDWCLKHGYDHPEASFAYLLDYAAANGKSYDDWDAALRNCIKGDWGKAREQARKQIALTPFVAKPKHKCIRCEVPCDGVDWKGNKYCAKCYGELRSNERGADLKALMEKRSAA